MPYNFDSVHFGFFDLENRRNECIVINCNRILNYFNNFLCENYNLIWN